MLYELPIVDFEDPNVCVLSRTLSENVSKTLKQVAFLVAFQIIPTFSKTGHMNKKQLMMSEKVWTSANKVVYAEGTYLR